MLDEDRYPVRGPRDGKRREDLTAAASRGPALLEDGRVQSRLVLPFSDFDPEIMPHSRSPLRVYQRAIAFAQSPLSWPVAGSASRALTTVSPGSTVRTKSLESGPRAATRSQRSTSGELDVTATDAPRASAASTAITLNCLATCSAGSESRRKGNRPSSPRTTPASATHNAVMSTTTDASPAEIMSRTTAVLPPPAGPWTK